MSSYFQSLADTSTLYFAHRGFWGYDGLTQNTMPGYQEAIRLNADFIECDVHATKDNILVLHHDPEIKLQDETSILIADLKVQDLEQLHNTKKINFKIPTLTELLHLVSLHKMGINIELKGDSIALIVYNLLQKYPNDLREKVVISSFSDQQLFAYRERDPNIDISLLRIGEGDDLTSKEEWLALKKAVKTLSPVSISLANQGSSGALLSQYTINKVSKLVAQCNIRIGVYTVNDLERLHELVEWGCSYFFSDKVLI